MRDSTGSTSAGTSDACATCPVHHTANLVKLGVNMEKFDFVVALAGNPNTGKSTVFNAITGLRQHTGNWPGKTVVRAEGGFALGDNRYKLVDLPGTYSLQAASIDEEVARNFILFGRPDVTVVVVDANHLERNLNLTLQVLDITDRVVICLNLVDEARRHGRVVDERALAKKLGVPVVSTVARSGQGIDRLLDTIAGVARGEIVGKSRRLRKLGGHFQRAVQELVGIIESEFQTLSNAEWVAIRLLDGDRKIEEALSTGELQELAALPADSTNDAPPEGASSRILGSVRALRWEVGAEFQDRLTEDIYAEAAAIAEKCTIIEGQKTGFDLDRTIDALVTSKWLGFPIMIGLLTAVFWITISGANVPSGLLASLLINKIHPALWSIGNQIGFPWWLSGFLFDGVYLAAAWVISVMLPPMAIFFPLFTLLEDSGYLARVSFNLDGMFKRAGAHGKQALTMSMGFGCNAAGVVATRIIDSRRERLIAIITNNFALCNGRWPTQILIATIFIGALVPAHLAGLVSAAAVVGVAILGVSLTFVVSWVLSHTMLRGEQSAFSLELPPYRRPRIWQTIYTSLIDRTIFVLWRAILFAVPAGALIWLLSNISIGGMNVSQHIVGSLDPWGFVLGLNGVILVAYILAIPANEIVIPTLLMLTVMTSGLAGVGEGAGVMFELDSVGDTEVILRAGGWTLLTGVNLMLFSLIHNPCSTTVYTIWKETRSRKWTVVSALLPLLMGFVVCFLVAQVWRIATGG
ncbi:MAG: ferrous iron transport protein B [Candidatus Krumholzibacteria bacterium]|nr:ferrous iron transport protein B [Candidatus Krumholzibacteria bacterium]